MVRPLREVLVHCSLVHCGLVHCGLVHCRLEHFFLRISDLIGDVFYCVGRLKRVLFVCSEKGVCRQYRPSPLHLPVVGEYGCAFSTTFHVTVWSVLLSFSFQMCSLSSRLSFNCMTFSPSVGYQFHARGHRIDVPLILSTPYQ